MSPAFRTVAALMLSIDVASLHPPASRAQRDTPMPPFPDVAARESRIRIGGASLYARDIGRGQPLIVLHGGPDFDHSYLLPDLDALSDSYRLLYYDQRGRGKSAAGVQPEDVSLATDVEDIDRVRRHFGLPTAAVVGHSWGSVLALEYALRHPTRVSHLVLMNPAPSSSTDVVAFRKAYVAQLGDDVERQRAIAASAAYKAGEPDAVTARYRLHFKHALTKPEHYEKLMAVMAAGFKTQGREGIIKARAVEDRLMRATWEIPSYDLLPRIRALRIPALVIAAEDDFIPVALSERTAAALPNARLAKLAGCGHFAYLECPSAVRRVLDEFFARR